MLTGSVSLRAVAVGACLVLMFDWCPERQTSGWSGLSTAAADDSGNHWRPQGSKTPLSIKSSAQRHCPLCQNPVNGAHYLDVLEHRIYHCGKKRCRRQITKNPKKSIYKLRLIPGGAQHAISFQRNCLVCGKSLPRGGSKYVYYGGRLLHACPGRCAIKIERNIKKYSNKHLSRVRKNRRRRIKELKRKIIEERQRVWEENKALWLAQAARQEEGAGPQKNDETKPDDSGEIAEVTNGGDPKNAQPPHLQEKKPPVVVQAKPTRFKQPKVIPYTSKDEAEKAFAKAEDLFGEAIALEGKARNRRLRKVVRICLSILNSKVMAIFDQESLLKLHYSALKHQTI